jgi:hypothetical protein
LPCGIRFDPHAALLAHHVALLVELAEDGGSGETLRFQQEPQLDAVRGQAVEEAGGILAGFGVEAGSAVLLDGARIGVGTST